MIRVILDFMHDLNFGWLRKVANFEGLKSLHLGAQCQEMGSVARESLLALADLEFYEKNDRDLEQKISREEKALRALLLSIHEVKEKLVKVEAEFSNANLQATVILPEAMTVLFRIRYGNNEWTNGTLNRPHFSL